MQLIIVSRLFYDVVHYNPNARQSTFTAGLNVSFCGLGKALLNNGAYAQRLFNVGVLLSFFSMTCHMFNIIISGRAAALCSDHTIVKVYPLSYFHDSLATCEQLYLHGTIIFVTAVLEMSFAMFDNVVYPAVFCGVAALAGLVLVTGRYRKVSVMYRNMVKLKAVATTLGGKVRSR